MAKAEAKIESTIGVGGPEEVKARRAKLQTQLPYLSAPGTVKTILEKISAAATPERVTSDFVSTKIGLKGGTGGAVVPFLKKLGMVGSDGITTETYRQFRNSTRTVSGAAIATAIKHGYEKLAAANEYFFDLDDKGLQALIVQVTGAEATSSAARQIFSTLKALKESADFQAPPAKETRQKDEAAAEDSEGASAVIPQNMSMPQTAHSLNLSYTINLNLPATSDSAVFNAIFRSLKEHLLSK